jgi:hypothetical protein
MRNLIILLLRMKFIDEKAHYISLCVEAKAIPIRSHRPNEERKTGLEPATYSLGSCRSTR